MSFNPQKPPLLTADLPGIGGRIRERPEDFEVEEIPAYEPSGSGEHLFLWVEKTGVGAEYFLRQIARRLRISDRDVGSAGLKDRHAITRQWLSVPATAESLLPQLDGDGIKLLNTSRHSNKLRPGHLRGNRFRILIRGADESSAEQLQTTLGRLRELGLPNYYGSQRFGRDGETSALGMALLKGEPDANKPELRKPFLRKLALSAAQSLMFNRVLGQRLVDGLFRTALSGDAMMKWPFGGLFTAEDVPIEQDRFNRREIVSGGPMFGSKMFPTHRQAADREAAVLTEFGLTLEHFGNFGKLLTGTRRHNLIYIDDLSAAWEPEGLRLAFSLPSGSYATVLLNELMKNEPISEDDTNDS